MYPRLSFQGIYSSSKTLDFRSSRKKGLYDRVFCPRYALDFDSELIYVDFSTYRLELRELYVEKIWEFREKSSKKLIFSAKIKGICDLESKNSVERRLRRANKRFRELKSDF